MRKSKIVLAAACSIVVLGSCSSGGGTRSTDSRSGKNKSSSPSKSEFVEQADAICKKYDDRRNQLLGGLNLDQNDIKGSAAKIVDKILPTQRAEIAELEKLVPPAADAAMITKLWADLTTATDDLEHTLETDPQKALGDTYDPYAALDKTAQRYGFTDCGSTDN